MLPDPVFEQLGQEEGGADFAPFLFVGTGRAVAEDENEEFFVVHGRLFVP